MWKTKFNEKTLNKYWQFRVAFKVANQLTLFRVHLITIKRKQIIFPYSQSVLIEENAFLSTKLH